MNFDSFHSLKIHASLNTDLFRTHELRYMMIRTKHVAGRFQDAYEHSYPKQNYPIR